MIYSGFLLLTICGSLCAAFDPSGHAVERYLTDNCDGYHDYRTLQDLVTHDTCLGVDKVFTLLGSVYHKAGVSCRIGIIRLLAGKFGKDSTTPSHCTCRGTNVLQHYSISGNDGIHGDYNGPCLQHDYYYKEIFNDFFHHSREGRTPVCRTHHSLWFKLDKISHSGSYSHCQVDLVLHLEYAFNHHHDPCICSEALSHNSATTRAPTIPTTTTRATTTTIKTTTKTTSLPPASATTSPGTTPTAATTTVPVIVTSVTPRPYELKNYQCDKLSTIQSVALNSPTSVTNTTQCNKGGTNEAFVMSNCNVSSPAQWMKGLKVMDTCTTTPLYTPVATFGHDSYVHDGAESGVFLGCLEGGFRLAVEHCNSSPVIDHIVGGLFNRDPNNYFVIS